MKNFFKRYTPAKHKVQQHPHLHLLGDRFHDPDVWHLTRRSVAGGAAVGLFCAFIPLPIQTITAAALAILFRVNLPLAAVFTLASNPVTFTPLFILAYEIGAGILDVSEHHVVIEKMSFEFSLHWFTHTMAMVWEPLLLGCFLLGSISALIGYVSIRLFWRIASLRKWDKRRTVMSNKRKTL